LDAAGKLAARPRSVHTEKNQMRLDGHPEPPDEPGGDAAEAMVDESAPPR
jgi:hypothetical protein